MFLALAFLSHSRSNHVTIKKSNITRSRNMVMDFECTKTYTDQKQAFPGNECEGKTTIHVTSSSWINPDKQGWGNCIWLNAPNVYFLLDECRFEGSPSGARGGAIDLQALEINITNNVFIRCSSTTPEGTSVHGGGAICLNDASVGAVSKIRIVNNEITDCKAVDGHGGGIFFEIATQMNIYIEKVTFTRCTTNHALLGNDFNGGAILFKNKLESVTIVDCNFISCTSVGQGGAIAIEIPAGGAAVTATYKILGCSFTTMSGKSNFIGIVAYAENGINFEINKSELRNTTMDNTGASGTSPNIMVGFGTMRIEFLTFQNTNGVVVNNLHASKSVSLINCTFKNCQGGSFFSGNINVLNLTESIFENVARFFPQNNISNVWFQQCIFKDMTSTTESILDCLQYPFTITIKGCTYDNAFNDIVVDPKFKYSTDQVLIEGCHFYRMTRAVKVSVECGIVCRNCVSHDSPMFTFTGCRNVKIQGFNGSITSGTMISISSLLTGYAGGNPNEIINCNFEINGDAKGIEVVNPFSEALKISGNTFSGISTGFCLVLTGSFALNSNTFKARTGSGKLIKYTASSGSLALGTGEDANCFEVKFKNTFETADSGSIASGGSVTDKWTNENNKCLFATQPFTDSNEFPNSKYFDSTDLYTNSKLFSRSGNFDSTKIFTGSKPFISSTIFTKSDYFEGSRYFSRSILFTKTIDFISSEVFSKSKDFSFFSRLTHSRLFSKSKNLEKTEKMSESIRSSSSESYISNEGHSIFDESINNKHDSLSYTQVMSDSNPFLSSRIFSLSHEMEETTVFSVSPNFKESIMFTNSAMFKKSLIFSYSVPFQSSHMFSFSNKYQSTLKFTISKIFDLSAEFRRSKPFVDSLIFSKSRNFVFSMIFIRSTQFEMTNQFDESKQFVKSNIFSHSKQFQETTLFTFSNQFEGSFLFSHSKEFMKTQRFSHSEIFDQSKQFSDSIQYDRSIQFSHSSKLDLSNQFSQSMKYERTILFSSSFHFETSTQFSKSNIFHSSKLFSRSNEMKETNIFSPSKKFKDSQIFSHSETISLNQAEIISSEMEIEMISSLLNPIDNKDFDSSNVQIHSEEAFTSSLGNFDDFISSKETKDNQQPTSAPEVPILSSRINKDQTTTLLTQHESMSMKESETKSLKNILIDSSEMNFDSMRIRTDKTKPRTQIESSEEGNGVTEESSQMMIHTSNKFNEEHHSIHETQLEKSLQNQNSDNTMKLSSNEKEITFNDQLSSNNEKLNNLEPSTLEEIIKSNTFNSEHQASIHSMYEIHSANNADINSNTEQINHFESSEAKIHFPNTDNRNSRSNVESITNTQKIIKTGSQPFMTSLINKQSDITSQSIHQHTEKEHSLPHLITTTDSDPTMKKETETKFATTKNTEISNEIITSSIKIEATSIYQNGKLTSDKEDLKVETSEQEEFNESLNSVQVNNAAENDSKASGGLIAGIVVAVIVIIIAVVLLIYFLLIMKKKGEYSSTDASIFEADDEIFTGSTINSAEIFVNPSLSNDEKISELVDGGNENDNDYEYEYEEVAFVNFFR